MAHIFPEILELFLPPIAYLDPSGTVVLPCVMCWQAATIHHAAPYRKRRMFGHTVTSVALGDQGFGHAPAVGSAASFDFLLHFRTNLHALRSTLTTEPPVSFLSIAVLWIDSRQHTECLVGKVLGSVMQLSNHHL